MSHYVNSQEHLLHKTEQNPQPTTMPPPSTGLGGAMGERFVVCFIGLPARGKQFMAERLTRYLRFFHGATCQMFDIAQPEYAGDDTHIAASLCAYLEEQDATATTQLRTALDLGALDEESLDRLKKNVDSGKIAVIHTSDPFKTLKSTWCGSSKDKRWSMQKQLAKLSVHVKLLFVEVACQSFTVPPPLPPSSSSRPP